MKTLTNITYSAFALFVLACFALSPQARAVCQDGCLTNDNTVLGDGALIKLTYGRYNTATGFNALMSNTEGDDNTANGFKALWLNRAVTLHRAAAFRLMNSAHNSLKSR
jgi:hypothetical protein